MITTLLSSTIKDLIPDRTIVVKSLSKSKLIKFIGVTPIIAPSNNASSYVATMKMAEECNLYILLLGGRYGYKTNHDSKSATELEFETAYRADPTKILIFKKDFKRADKDQSNFIEKISDYHKGYYIYRYKDLEDLEKICMKSFIHWISERAAIGSKLTYFDHFVRLAVQRSPFPNVHPTYTIAENHIELKYKIAGQIFSIHFEKSYLYNDFWGNVSLLENHFDKWRKEFL